MSSDGTFLPSVPFQKSIISGNLNSTLMLLFLSGGYIGFYVFTLAVYVPAQQSGKTVVISVLSVLFVTTLGQLILNWYYTYISLVGLTSDRLDMFYLSLGSAFVPVETILNITMQGIGLISADALLVWRCWHILAQRRYLRLAVNCLYIGEVAIITAAIALGSIQLLHPTYQTVQFTRVCNIMQGGSFVVTAATSMISTFVIGAHIYASTNLISRIRRRYTYIIEILAQSSALYSLSILALAIADFVDNGDLTLTLSSVFNAEAYTNAIALINTAFAPTLMVARLALSREKASEDVLSDIPSDILVSMVPSA